VSIMVISLDWLLIFYRRRGHWDLQTCSTAEPKIPTRFQICMSTFKDISPTHTRGVDWTGEFDLP